MLQHSESSALKDIGQLFMVGLPGTELDESSRGLIKEFRINNFIYFKRNVGINEYV